MALPRLLESWSASPAVRGAAIVSEDGLLVHDLLPPGADADAVAALAVTVLRQARQLAEAAGGSAVRRLVVDLGDGTAALVPIDNRHTLVVLAGPGQDLGALLFEIRRSAAALSEAI